ncbi:MAG: hypothetical protein SGARI_005367 [Bacillariaceae sp.]
MHPNCSVLLLNHGEIPPERRPTDATIVFCTKTCFNRWEGKQKSLQRAAEKSAKDSAKAASEPRVVPWDKDGSMEVLMDWITTEGNHAECCGCTGNKGKSKSQFQKELSLLIKAKTGADRTDKQVENKINTIERQFKKASDWLANTGAGLDDPGSIKTYVLKLCPVYYDVEAVMSERPNARPLATNEDSDSDEVSNTFNYGNDEDDSASAPEDLAPAAASAATPSARITRTSTPTSSLTTSVGTKRKAPADKRLTASTRKKPAKKNDVEEYIKKHLSGAWPDDIALESISNRNCAAKEKEADARMLEAKANSNKANQEAEKMRLESDKVRLENEILKVTLENKILNIEQKKDLLKARNEMKEFCTVEELDRLFPLPK